MRKTKKQSVLFLMLCICTSANATWSIIIVDPVTREIGIAGASCTYSVYGIGGIVPGKGAIVAQAMSNMKAKAKGLEMIRLGYSPDSILYTIIDNHFDANSSQQQYAIISVDHIAKPVSFTGGATHDSRGSLASEGISVQGNTLASDQVIKAVFDTVINARKMGLSIKESLMRGLEAGSLAGGDVRCGKQKASSAFITVMQANDDPKKPYLNLFVSGIDKGGRNAVEVLKGMYQNRVQKIKK